MACDLEHSRHFVRAMSYHLEHGRSFVRVRKDSPHKTPWLNCSPRANSGMQSHSPGLPADLFKTNDFFFFQYFSLLNSAESTVSPVAFLQIPLPRKLWLHLPTSTFGGSLWSPMVTLIAWLSQEISQSGGSGHSGPSSMPLETKTGRLGLTLILPVFSQGQNLSGWG